MVLGFIRSIRLAGSSTRGYSVHFCRVSIVLGTSKTIKLYEVPKSFGFN